MVSGWNCGGFWRLVVDRVRWSLIGFASLFIIVPAVAGTLPNGASAINEVYHEWHLDCRNSEDGVKCKISQRLLEGKSQQVFFRIEFTPMASGEPHGLMITPFGLSLVEGVTVETSGETVGDVYAFSTCLPTGCEAPFDLDELQFKNFLKTENVKFAFTTLKGKVVNFQLSTAGLSDALTRASFLMK
ncbi:invasion associated locus B family protein [Acetobacteraceae bacterium ESL0709]|nr:invasion associated locus B family protein [Acetobacteraceae bacterium ESL0697]MDF7677220.1 invasion associated locus B family protein [Acetobacteraceae bacterium ESL0709]